MISGSVNAGLEAMASLQVEDSAGHLHVIDTVIDTGFTGQLTLPLSRISAMGLCRVGQIVTQLADGTVQMTDAYDTILFWDGYAVQVRIQAVQGDPLLGTRLLAGHELKIHFVPGGAVTIAPIP